MDKPLVSRRPWRYVEYTSFVEGTCASTLPPPPFEMAGREAIIDEARKLYAESLNQKDPAKAVELLSKLITDPRMKSVWTELYKKKRVHHKPTDEFVNPIFVRNASIAAWLRQHASTLRKKSGAQDALHADTLDAEARLLEKKTSDPLARTPWTEQELGVQLFLWHIYHATLEPKPVFLSDIKAEVNALRHAAEQLRAQAEVLQSLHIECAALQQIAANCDSEARLRDRDPKTDDPWIISRRVHDAQLRTFVATLSIITDQLCKKTLYGTIATIANVVFSRNDVTGSTVREMLRSPPGA
jgi:hypothetical protein